MAITKTELLEDRLVIHQDFQQPSGWQDKSEFGILYTDIPSLPLLPNGESGEEIPVPACKQTLVFVEFSRREPETFDGCRSHHYQIYLKPKQNQQEKRGDMIPMGGGDDDISMEQPDNYDLL